MENDYQCFLDARGVETPCPACSGLGVKAYSSTAGWQGGFGGQQITSGVCDKCWGSGDKHRPWASWRELSAIRDENKRLKEKLCQMAEKYTENIDDKSC
ncbi:MAG: hypothetical protein ACYSUB_01600 [Planctomycetota bacterium]|jgi:hypothetical protein